MKKIYLKTTLLIPTLLIFTLLSCEKKIDWRMSVSAPQHYGATIEAEYFSEGKSVAAIRGGGSSGWGVGMDGLTSGQSDKKPIPDLVKVNCYSAREGITYVADITLPKKEMKKLFDEKLFDSISETVNQYKTITCGCAPGGEMVMWLRGYTFLKEIARAKGKEIKRESPQEREAYFNKMPPKEQEWIKNNPIPYGTWNQYDKKFVWQPIILADSENKISLGNGFRFFFINGDTENISSWKYDYASESKEDAYPTPESWEEIINYNYRKDDKKSIPYYVLLQWTPLKDNKSLEAEILLPANKLKKIFEEGYRSNKGKKQFSKVVFEVFNNKNVKIWLAGDDGYKILLKETKGDFLY